MAGGSNTDLPAWARTLINATLCGCVVVSLTTILSLRESISLVRQDVGTIKTLVGKDLEAATLRQRVVDEQQDSKIAAIAARLDNYFDLSKEADNGSNIRNQ